MSSTIWLLAIPVLVVSMCASLQIANALITSADFNLKFTLCKDWRGDQIKQGVPYRGTLESSGRGHDYIVGGATYEIIRGGAGDGCYDGGEGADKIYIGTQGGESKYVIDGDANPDNLYCTGTQSPKVLVIEGRKDQRYINLHNCPDAVTHFTQQR